MRNFILNTSSNRKGGRCAGVAASTLCAVSLLGFSAAAQLVVEDSATLKASGEAQTMPALMATENSLDAKAAVKLNAQIDKATDAAVESQSEAAQAETTARAEAGVAGETLARQRTELEGNLELGATSNSEAESSGLAAENSAESGVRVYDAEPVATELLQEATVDTPALGAYEPETENKDLPESNRSGLNTEVRTGLKLRFGDSSGE